MSTTVTYKGSTLTTVDNQTRTLLTQGKYLEDNLTLTDVSSSAVSFSVAYDSSVTALASSNISITFSGITSEPSSFAFLTSDMSLISESEVLFMVLQKDDNASNGYGSAYIVRFKDSGKTGLRIAVTSASVLRAIYDSAAQTFKVSFNGSYYGYYFSTTVPYTKIIAQYYS